jgi:hypothetical protein
MLADRLTDQKVDDYLAYLSDNDDEYARLKANVERCKIKARRIEAVEYLSVTGPAQERKYLVDMSARVVAAWEQHADAIETYERMKNKRETLDKHIDVWRTFASGKKHGLHL